MGFFLNDFIDGQLARRLRVQSFFGSLLDALSDKAFGIVCLLLLSTLNPIFLVIIGIELGIFAINYKSAQNNNNVKTSYVGKAKTLLLAGTIVGSFFCYAAPTVKEILNYVNISSFNSLLELNPDLLSSLLAIPAIGVNAYVAKDYKKTALNQEIKKENISKNKKTLSQIAEEREELLRKKEEIKVLKSRQEIMHDLFDTDFYLEHKDDNIKSLLYKKR